MNLIMAPLAVETRILMSVLLSLGKHRPDAEPIRGQK